MFRCVDARSLYVPCSTHATERACSLDPECIWFDPRAYWFPITEARPACLESWYFHDQNRKVLAEWGPKSGVHNYAFYASGRRNDTNDTPPASPPASPPPPMPVPVPSPLPSPSPSLSPSPSPSLPPPSTHSNAFLSARRSVMGLCFATGLVTWVFLW